MASSSQRLEDSPAHWATRRNHTVNPQELYNESHRLALEELVSGGVDRFTDFLKKERIPNFISEEEVRRLLRGAVVPRCSSSVTGEDSEQSVSGSMDCSSLTYFPEVSDLDPPLLEVGWPAFTAGSYRGVTRAAAHFQPSYGETIYSCKEAARRMIRSAKEVIAIVTDSLTDLDVFRDLQEACGLRKVPVYVLLDRRSVAAFLEMLCNTGVCLDALPQMRVRSLSGTTYYLRSGASISGKVHERFMLIDGNRVATGSYRFNWTDGRLNSSNLVELSGQITEKFDEEFRILYAQSLPLAAQAPPPRARTSGAHERLLLLRHASSSPRALLLTSTPGRPRRDPLTPEGARDSPAPGEEWAGEEERQRAEGMSESRGEPPVASAPRAPVEVAGGAAPPATVDRCSQTEPGGPGGAGGSPLASAASDRQPPTSPAPHPPAQPHQAPPAAARRPDPWPPAEARSDPAGAPGADGSLRDCFTRLSRERRLHYASIRSRLEGLASALAQRSTLADLTNVPAGGHGAGKDRGAGPPSGDHVSTGTWPRARCLH